MIRKLILGLAAVATIGSAALAPTAASAGGFFHHHHYSHGLFLAPAPIFVGTPIITPSCFERRLVPTRKGLRWRTVNVCAF